MLQLLQESGNFMKVNLLAVKLNKFGAEHV